MEQLLQQLTKTLKIPTNALQTVLDNYPKLRQEYVIYSSLGTIRNTMLLVIALNVFLAWLTTDTDNNENLLDSNLKMLKIEMIMFLTATVIAVVLTILMTVLAPDIAIIKEIINK